MLRNLVLALLLTGVVAACTGEYPIFEDRSDQVRIKKRIPSK